MQLNSLMGSVMLANHETAQNIAGIDPRMVDFTSEVQDTSDVQKDTQPVQAEPSPIAEDNKMLTQEQFAEQVRDVFVPSARSHAEDWLARLDEKIATHVNTPRPRSDSSVSSVSSIDSVGSFIKSYGESLLSVEDLEALPDEPAVCEQTAEIAAATFLPDSSDDEDEVAHANLPTRGQFLDTGMKPFVPGGADKDAFSTAVLLPCGDIFDRKFITDLLLTPTSNNTCPLCEKPLFKPEDMDTRVHRLHARMSPAEKHALYTRASAILRERGGETFGIEVTPAMTRKQDKFRQAYHLAVRDGVMQDDAGQKFNGLLVVDFELLTPCLLNTLSTHLIVSHLAEHPLTADELWLPARLVPIWVSALQALRGRAFQLKAMWAELYALFKKAQTGRDPRMGLLMDGQSPNLLWLVQEVVTALVASLCKKAELTMVGYHPDDELALANVPATFDVRAAMLKVEAGGAAKMKRKSFFGGWLKK